MRLGAFCDLVSLAVASAQAREDLQTSRARIVRAGDEQRRRLERNLHDGAQQRLVAATLLLRVAQAQLAKDPPRASQLLQDAARELDAAWKGKAQMTVDNAQIRYFIVHLHRLLDPEATGPGAH